MDRRRAVAALVGLPLSIRLGRLQAATTPGSPKLLVVFLRGGYDCANLLVPVASDFYYSVRPNIAIARPGSDAAASLPLDADWGLHPALRDTLFPLYQKGQLAFVPFAGTDDLSRSHFETQDSIELGQGSGSGRDFRSGFLNRLAEVVSGRAPIAFTDQLPLVFRGNVQVANTALRSVGKPALDARQSALVAAMYRTTPLGTRVDEAFNLRDEVAREMAGEMEAANRNAANTKGFEQEARRVARLMQEKYDLAFVDVGGWDTHVGQGGATGYLANRLEELGRGLAGFAEAMGQAWTDTIVVVMSEFGRTFRENGNRGTDHGHGSVYWVLGGAVRGGRVVGERVRVEQRTLFQDRDYPVLNDYRALMGGLFGHMYGLSREQSQKVFPGVQPRDFGLV